MIATGDDGRVVVNGQWPDDLSGMQSIETIGNRNIIVNCAVTGRAVGDGMVDVGKHLRPNLRGGRIVLFAERGDGNSDVWKALKMT